VSAGLGIDELRCYTEVIAGAPDAALKHIADTELSSVRPSLKYS
jgi:hypothetical protein